MMLSTEGGEAINLTPCARSQGTTIDVRDIFFNAPVRKKFLKSERSEFQAIEMIVRRFALSAPEIAIHLSHNGKQQFNIPAARCDKTQFARVRKLLGKTFIEEARYIDIEHAGLRLQGWICTADYQRSQNDKQWIYVNKRMVRDKLLNHAVKQAYEALLHPGRFPACLLYLTINPAEVDVNVHPTKHEVRFQQPRLVHDFIRSQIQGVLEQGRALIRPAGEGEDSGTFSLQAGEGARRADEGYTLQAGKGELCEPYLPPRLIKKTTNLAGVKNWFALHASFALLFLHDQPYLVDLVGLQRNWLLSILTAQSLPLARRPLLVPVSHTIKSLSLESIHLYREALSQIGMELDLLGENSVLVRTIPTAIPHLDLQQFLTTVFNSSLPSIGKLFELLTLCQSFNSQHAQEEEIETLIGYLQTLASDKLKICCKHLSIETCRGLLNA